jgi:DNA-binding NarL/FixJ family response regulator
MLEQEPEFEIVGEASDSDALPESIERSHPDVVLLDWELPGNPPEPLLNLLRSSCPGAKVVALSGRPEARLPALQAGVDSFVSKGDPPEALLGALQAIQNGTVTPEHE